MENHNFELVNQLSMPFFNSKLLVYQRVNKLGSFGWIWCLRFPRQWGFSCLSVAGRSTSAKSGPSLGVCWSQSFDCSRCRSNLSESMNLISNLCQLHLIRIHWILGSQWSKFRLDVPGLFWLAEYLHMCFFVTWVSISCNQTDSRVFDSDSWLR